MKDLLDIVRFMRASAGSYDDGYVAEAERLAVCIKAVVTDAGGESLLKRAGLADMLFYDNSTDYRPELGLPFSGLAIPVRELSEGFRPRLGMNPRIRMEKVPFEYWWNKVVIADESKGLRITREGVVTSVANSFAGEADPRLNDAYNELILDIPIGWVDESAGPQKELMGLEFASVRQIAFELLKSIEEQGLPRLGDGG